MNNDERTGTASVLLEQCPGRSTALDSMLFVIANEEIHDST